MALRTIDKNRSKIMFHHRFCGVCVCDSVWSKSNFVILGHPCYARLRNLGHICPTSSTQYNRTSYKKYKWPHFGWKVRIKIKILVNTILLLNIQCILKISAFLKIMLWNIIVERSLLMGPMLDLAKGEPWRRSIVRGWLYFTGSSSTV